MKKNYTFTITELKSSDQEFLFEMLYQSIFVAPTSSPPDRNIINVPEIRKYVENWGKEGDFGYIAIDNISGKKIGAIWLRYFDAKNKGYGYISDNIPEIGISVDRSKRDHGVGSKLINTLLTYTKNKIDTISLSVDPANPVVKLYERFGFRKCGTAGTSIIMRYDN